MTNSPNPDHQSYSSNNKRLLLLVLSRGGIALGGLLLVGLVGGSWRLWNFIRNELAPLAEKGITTALNRPVKLGRVEEFSLTGVRFGASAIPATPTDPDRLAVNAVEAGFDPWQLLINRRLKLDVTLVNPDVYIEQDQQGRWISTSVAPPGKEGAIKTDVDKIRFRNAKLALVPQSKRGGNSLSSPPTPPLPNSSQVAFSQINGTAQLLENNQLIKFDLGGQLVRGGNISLQGDTRPKTQDYNLQMRGQELVASDITRLVKLPLDLQAGKVNGDLKIQWRQQEQPLLWGSADLQGVTFQVRRVPQQFLNSQGNLHFQGTEIKLDNVATNYGKIPLVANGIIDSKKGYKMAGRVNAVSLANAQETLKLKLPVPVSGEAKADLQIVGSVSQPILSGTAATTKPAKIDKVDFNEVSAKFDFAPATSVVNIKDIQGKAKVGGEVTGAGIVKVGNNPQVDFNLAAKNAPGDAIAKLYNAQPAFQIGTVSGTAQLTGAPGNVQTVVKWQAPQATYPATGETVIAADRSVLFRNVALNVGGGKVLADLKWVNQRWQGVAQASGVQLERLVDKNQLQNVSLAGAQFNGRLSLSGTSHPFKVATIRSEDARVQIAGGTVGVSNIQLEDKSFSAKLVADGVQVGRLLKQSPPALSGPLVGTFQISGNTDNFSLKTLRGSGKASLAVGGGTVTASNIQLANGRYQTRLLANDIKMQQLAQVPQQFQGALNGQLNVAGSVESFQLQTIQANGQARVNVAGGTVTASNIQVADGRYQAVVDASKVELNRFSPQLQGQLGGKLQVAGSVGGFSLADVRGKGQVQISRGIGGMNRPLNAAIAWNGERLNIERATAPGLNASGYVAVQTPQGASVPEITDLNLNVQAQNYNLQQLPLNLPNAIQLAGNADFNGTISGKLPTPNVRGKFGLRDLVVNTVAFEPVLTGNVQSEQGRGLNLDLRGKSDRIALNLDTNNRGRDAKFRVSTFEVRRDQALATGQAQGENLAVNVEKFPVQTLNLNVPANIPLRGDRTVAGLLTGDFLINQQTFATTGNVAIANPQIGQIKGDRFVAQFDYGNGTATIKDSELVKGKSRYAIAGTVTQTPKGPQVQGNVKVNEGNIQDVLTALQLYELQDFQGSATTANNGTAADLITNSVGLPDQPLLTQLQHFAEIQSLQAQQQQQRRDASLVPELRDLNGTLNGEVAVDTATANGLAVKFNLNGQNFVWGKKEEPERFYHAERVIAQGDFENGVLRLIPFRIESKNRLIAFTGNIGGTEQSGQLRVNNFPVQLLNNYIKLPVGFTGNINATAALAGSIANPQAKGELQLSNGTLNQKGVESAVASFSYADGRLNFGSNVMVSGPEPVTINGSIPYQLPFATTIPDSDQISLDMKVKNQGLVVLNLFTDQVAFENGLGEIDLTVRGTRQQPQVKGIATVNNATFSAQAFSGKLTDITGEVDFNFDRVFVKNLQGNFNRGKVAASGEIPVFNNQQTQTNNPLTVTFDQLALNLKELYEGGASGNLQITGAALNPIIGGQVFLNNGKVLLAQSENATTLENTRNINFESVKANKQQNPEVGKTGNSTTRFNNLQLELGKKVEITRAPILNFQATGTLNVNGSLREPLPEGTIRLRSGGVNLFTTQFNLASGYEHTATFRANQPRDPDLDIRLFAKVLDVIQSTNLKEDENPTGLGALETVRVEARIQGPASQLDQSLELKSSPARTETEIVALLGGGFGQDIARGDTTLGLANIAGTAVLNNFQGAFNEIGNAFGLSELRLFPTVLSDNPKADRSNSSLELAGEAGVDVSPKVSISGLKILTADDPIQWGVNYRINDDIRLRGSTNLEDDSRAAIEYEKRF